MKLIFVPNSEIIKCALEVILGSETGVAQITRNSGPIVESAIIEPTEIIGYDEWRDVVCLFVGIAMIDL